MTEVKTNIFYNPSLAAALASNLLFMCSAWKITLAPEMLVLQQNKPFFGRCTIARRQAWGSLLGAAGRAGISLLAFAAFAGYYSLFMETKEGIQCICFHLSLCYFSIFSNYPEIPRWGDDFLPIRNALAGSLPVN